MPKKQLTALQEANRNLGTLTEAKPPEFLAELAGNLVVCVHLGGVSCSQL